MSKTIRKKNYPLDTIGIIGYGMVGKAVEYGFPNCKHLISDPAYNNTSATDVCNGRPSVIFIAVPTLTDDKGKIEHQILDNTLDEVEASGYTGLVVVKSTILPHFLENRGIVYNPEFLSRATSFNDFVNPPMLILGGDRSKEVLDLYKLNSNVLTDKVFLTDIKTAAFAKYAMNTFYATKITFMNELYHAFDGDWEELTSILKEHPWMGSHHFEVPGPDGSFGFGGPCFPKDSKALATEYNMELLNKVLELNDKYTNINT